MVLTLVFTKKCTIFIIFRYFNLYNLLLYFAGEKSGIFVGGLCTYAGRSREKRSVKWIKTATLILRDLVFNFLFNPFHPQTCIFIYCLRISIIFPITWMSWIMNLNWGDRSVHVFTSSIALSKFFTYSPYILRKGANFCRISPILGVVVLQSKRVESQSKMERKKVTQGYKSFQVFNRESFCLGSPYMELQHKH